MMEGKVVMVTGATNGIGKIAATEIAKLGAAVIVVSRNAQRCEDTVTAIKASTGNDKVSWMQADLSSLAEIRRLAADFLAKYDRLDVLLNNAGGYFKEYKESVDGYEMTLALNHLNYFLLTHLLLDRLKETAENYGEARIVNVSSAAHRMVRGDLDLDALLKTDKYKGFARYGESKMMNVMFTYELAKRLGDASKVMVNALHPGFVATGFGHNNSGWIKTIFGWGQSLFALSDEKGAQTSVFLASSPEAKGMTGQYFVKKRPRKSNKPSHNESDWAKLWALSEQMVGLTDKVEEAA